MEKNNDGLEGSALRGATIYLYVTCPLFVLVIGVRNVHRMKKRRERSDNRKGMSGEIITSKCVFFLGFRRMFFFIPPCLHFICFSIPCFVLWVLSTVCACVSVAVDSSSRRASRLKRERERDMRSLHSSSRRVGWWSQRPLFYRFLIRNRRRPLYFVVDKFAIFS